METRFVRTAPAVSLVAVGAFSVSGASFNHTTKTLTMVGGFADYTWTDGDRMLGTGGVAVNVGVCSILSKLSDDAITLGADITSDASNPTDVSAVTASATPSNTNDGLDPVGLGIVDGAYTSADRKLVLNAGQSGLFALVRVGHLLWLESTAGGWGGLAEVESIDGDVCFFTTDVSGGMDAGDVTSSTGPYLTVENGLSNIAAGGDSVLLVNDGPHEINSTITIGKNGLRIAGVNTFGKTAGSGVTAVIRQSAGFPNDQSPLLTAVGHTGTLLADIEFDCDSHGSGAASDNVLVGDNAVLVRCSVHGSNGHGFAGVGGQFYDCLAWGNSGAGFSTGSGTTMHRCVAWNNSGSGGFQPSDRSSLVACLAYGNSGCGFLHDGGFEWTSYINCTAYGNGGAGFSLSSNTVGGAVYNNISQANIGAGFTFQSFTGPWVYIGHNQASGNSDDGTLLPGDGNVYTPATFLRPGTGADADFTPLAGTQRTGADRYTGGSSSPSAAAMGAIDPTPSVDSRISRIVRV